MNSLITSLLSTLEDRGFLYGEAPLLSAEQRKALEGAPDDLEPWLDAHPDIQTRLAVLLELPLLQKALGESYDKFKLLVAPAANGRAISLLWGRDPAILASCVDAYLADPYFVRGLRNEQAQRALDPSRDLILLLPNRKKVRDKMVAHLLTLPSERLAVFLSNPQMMQNLLNSILPQLAGQLTTKTTLLERSYEELLDAKRMGEATRKRMALGHEALSRNQATSLGDLLGIDLPSGHRPEHGTYPGRYKDIMRWLKETLAREGARAPFLIVEVGSGAYPRTPDIPSHWTRRKRFHPQTLELLRLLPPDGILESLDISSEIVDSLNRRPHEMVIFPKVHGMLAHDDGSYFRELAELGTWEENRSLGLILVRVAENRASQMRARRMDIATESYGPEGADVVFCATTDMYLRSGPDGDLFAQANLIKMLKKVKIGKRLVLLRPQNFPQVTKEKPLTPLTPEQLTAFGYELEATIPTNVPFASMYVYRRLVPSGFLDKYFNRIDEAQKEAEPTAKPKGAESMASSATLEGELKEVVEWLGLTKMAEATYGDPELMKWWEAHQQENKENIKQAVGSIRKPGIGNKDPKKRPVVMILGAGRCMDIPLAKLAEKFRLILVDLDIPSMERAIQELKPDLRRYVSWEARDISGGLVIEIASKIKKILDTAQDADSAIRAFNLEFNVQDSSLGVTDLTGGKPVDFLISSMVISQLPSYAIGKFELEMQRRFGVNPFSDATLNHRTNIFRSYVQVAHSASLAHFVRQTGGGVYYAADVMRHGVDQPLEKGVRLVFHPGRHLSDYFRTEEEGEGIHILDEKQWIWDHDPPRAFRTVHSVTLGRDSHGPNKGETRGRSHVTTKRGAGLLPTYAIPAGAASMTAGLVEFVGI